MNPIYTYNVIPRLPEPLRCLQELAHNLRWTWDHQTVDLFRRLDADLWNQSERNPVKMLGMIPQAHLEATARDRAFLATMSRACDDYRTYMTSKDTWYENQPGKSDDLLIAYFSAEFGISETLPIYSGGLGILAGDHLKSASDLGVPLVGLGLLYQKGYFRQYLNNEGWQQELYPINDFYHMPIRPERDATGEQLVVNVQMDPHTVWARIWRAQVGRVPLYLLDTNIPQNQAAHRDITDELYGGDTETRIQQEIVLGVGGMRALAALGKLPTVCHMNEGHAAFLALEWIRMLMQKAGVTFAEAREAASAGCVFTTHTPVPAGIDKFPPALVERYLGSYYGSLGLTTDEFLDLSRPLEHNGNGSEPLNMAILALRLSQRRNGVSKLHACVSREMWKGLWPGVPVEDVPIVSITNGVHPASWVSKEMRGLYDTYLGPHWSEQASDPGIWARVEDIPAEELWRTHERRRERVVANARRRLRIQLRARGAANYELAEAAEALDPSALTIGFARRAAAYKRAGLLFRDPERLIKILDNRERPVQIVLAGKAHPRDTSGKEIIRKIIQTIREMKLRRRVIFVEDYDSAVARAMVQGVDLWLNTPRRPLEACGTSGMKAAVNAVLNMSTRDGWWDEAAREGAGWTIGNAESYAGEELQDEVESNAIYDLLEKEVVPLFYERGRDNVPRGWTDKMRKSMKALVPIFNSQRMVQDYFTEFYVPAAAESLRLMEEDLRRAKELAAWRARIIRNWPTIRVVEVNGERAKEAPIGSKFHITARVFLGEVKPHDVTIEVYEGRIDENQQICDAKTIRMAPVGTDGDNGIYEFGGDVILNATGLRGFSLRILPNHPDLMTPFQPGLISWA